MTREEAFSYLSQIYATTYSERYRDALEVAISAFRPVSREQVEGIRGEWMHDGPKFEGGTDWYHCSKCGTKETGVYVKYNFCSHCGAPMTDEAVQMVMERLEALHETV